MYSKSKSYSNFSRFYKNIHRNGFLMLILYYTLDSLETKDLQHYFNIITGYFQNKKSTLAFDPWKLNVLGFKLEEAECYAKEHNVTALLDTRLLGTL